MALDVFADMQWATPRAHDAYEQSVFSPPAPENTTGEVLVGSAYRRLLLGVAESEVDLSTIDSLPERLAEAGEVPIEAWKAILEVRGGLGSPRLRGQRGPDALPQLSPFVPEIARYAGALGRPRGRWNPSNLLMSAIAAGSQPHDANTLLALLRGVLDVDGTDDILARFIQQELAAISGAIPTQPQLPTITAAAGRSSAHQSRTPAEQFCTDLRALTELKGLQTRKQFAVLLEASLRLGLTTHYLWLCRLNDQAWRLCLEAVERGDDGGWQRPDVLHIEKVCREGHHLAEPLLELGSDSTPSVQRWLRAFHQARIGFSVLYHALDSALLAPPTSRLATPPQGDARTASEVLTEFIGFLADNAATIRETVALRAGGLSLRSLAGRIADSVPKLLSASEGSSRQALFFLRYTMGQLQPREDALRSYDQSYLTMKGNRSNNAPWPVRPGPTLLLLMAYAACKSGQVAYQSIDGFRRYLSAYGISVPAGELVGGTTGKHLEQLGLSVESADAGGGRLVLDPFTPLRSAPAGEA